MKNYAKYRECTFFSRIRATILLVTLLLVVGGVFGSSKVLAVTLTPLVRASIHDEPMDGIGDSFNSEYFHGILRRQAGLREDRAILEFDLDSFAGQILEYARLDFQISVNNAIDPKFRAFDVFVYSGNGVRDLDDFSIVSTYVDTVGYIVPATGSFSIDVLNETQYILNEGGLFLGVRVDPLGYRNPPSWIIGNPILAIEAIPEPATLLLLGLGGLSLVRRRRS